VGTNTITVYVRAADAVHTQIYTLTVKRAAANLSTNALLNTLVLSPNTTVTLTTGPDYRDYTASEPNSVSSIQVTASAKDASATISVNGMAVAQGVKSQAIPLNVGSNVIATVVTAQDGASTKSYIITITRAAASLASQYVAVAHQNITQKAGITVHQNLSPNGDGNSDVLLIDGIAAFPENKVQIMNRTGVLVYEAKSYDNETKVFDGHSSINGKLQQAGTYFYSLEYKDGKETRHKTGFIVLKY
ncbi:MAG: gliding motility-associated C-terminal domain-containing protein, partial [Mucilaginibacter sp.]